MTARRAIARALLGLAAAGVVLAVAAWIYARQVLPQLDGTLTLAGPRAEIRIERDVDGIPTIRAGSMEDAAFGLGFVHAQDRLWQLETHRRIASGRLAEAFGEAAVDNDRFLRALGVRRAAAAQWRQASPRARAIVEAYTAGINAFLRDALAARPPEFVVLGVRPEPWTPEDSLGWAIMMAWDLGGNWGTELTRMRLSLTLPVSRIDELIPMDPGTRAPAVRDYAALYRALRVDGRLGEHAQAAAPPSGIEGAGSNNWAVAGARSETGRPLLANDPHLRLSAPALWYVARLVTPEATVAGATLPALPGVVLGQNEHVAWGFTNTGPDVQDLYLEQIDPEDPSRYRTPTGWARFETFDEAIRVRGGPDVNVTVRATRHGPVVSDAGRAAEGLTGPRTRPAYAIAMRWTALDPDPGALDAAIGFHTARSVAEFITASARHTAPMQNMVVADRDGHIGFVAAGKVPLRGPDHDLMGLAPAPGWEARYDWLGTLPAELTPREADPPRGWIATANTRIHAPDYAHHLTREWAPPYRQQRIEQLLEATPRHGIDGMRRMQADIVSLATRRLLPFLQRASSTHRLAAAAQRELARFDGTMSDDRAAPLLFWSWTRHLAEALFADELGEAMWQRTGRTFRDATEGVLERDDRWWCDDKRTPESETCAGQVDRAFTRALEELEAAYGPDVSTWRWGRAHVARSEHRPFSHVRPIARWFELRVPVGGDTYTVNVSRVNLRPDPITGERYLDDHGPSLRALYDVGDPGRSRVMHSTGQSGIAFSPLYRRFVTPWARVEDVPLWAGEAVHTLVLRPRATR